MEYQGEEKYKPISMWGYFGYQLLFCIPIAGFILLIIYSFSNKNINRRNFARSYFCLLIVAVVLMVIVFLIGGLELLNQFIQQSN